MSDPSLPVQVFAGPYGFLAVIFVCLFWGLREWRKGREQDVVSYRRRAEEAEAQKDAAETKNDREIALLSGKIENLQTDIRSLREQHFKDLERVTARYYETRHLLLSKGVPAEEIP